MTSPAPSAWHSLAGRAQISSALFYIAFFALTAFQLFNMTAWLGEKGINPIAAGRMQGTADLFFVGGVLLAGFVADWRGFNRRLFLGLFALAALGYLLLGSYSDALILTLALGLIHFAFMPMMPMMDAYVQPFISRDLLPYGRIRALGSASFMLVIGGLGLLTTAAMLDLFYTAILASLILSGIAVLFLPAHPYHDPQPPAAKLWAFGQILSQPHFLLFYLVAACIFGSHGAHYIYAVPVWQEWGFPPYQIYGLIAWSVLVEILFFLVAPKALTEQRAVPLLALCAVGGILRWTLWPEATGWPLLLFVHSLHALTFALAHLTSLAFLRRRVPEAQLGSAQALLPAISVGIGMASAKWIAAQFYSVDGHAMFWAMACFAGLALPLLAALHHQLKSA